MGSVNICCDHSAQGFGSEGYKDPFKEMKFEPSDGGEPVLNNEDYINRLKELVPTQSKIDPTRHPKAQSLMPMKQTTRGFIYHGEWINNKPDGFGKIYFPKGEYFEGEFMEGKAKGFGRFFYTNNAFFEGTIDQNRAEGEGIYDSKDVKFRGTWENSKPHIGTYELSDHTKIEIKDEHRGVIDWSDGRHYEGQIDSELNPAGHGNIHFLNGNSYEGDWRKGLMNGCGTYKWHNGQKYQGYYEQGVKQGSGTFYFNDDEKYEGQWENGKQNGNGKLFRKNEVIYDGKFKNGEPFKEDPIATAILGPSSGDKINSEIGKWSTNYDPWNVVPSHVSGASSLY